MCVGQEILSYGLIFLYFQSFDEKSFPNIMKLSNEHARKK